MSLPLHDFAKLMIAELAKNSIVKYLRGVDQKVVYLPFNYRERIENILCADNGWRERFSCLIDIEDYFNDHFWWEERLAEEIKNVTQELKKEITFDIVSEHMIIKLTQEEVEKIEKQYDLFHIERMKHFVDVMTSRIYSRRHKEEFVDYSAKSAAKMKKINSGAGIDE